MKNICDGCGKKVKGSGGLGNHARYDKSCTMPMRFWGKVDKSGGPVACWIWRGSRNKQGRATFNYHGHIINAHRVAWFITHGEVESKVHLLHSCDNLVCVNPAHLRPGNDKDNAADRVARGRHNFGERNSHARLTEAQVLEIRRDYIPGKGGNKRELAAKYGVGMGLIVTVANGHSWKHLPLRAAHHQNVLQRTRGQS
jgi:hypothetical protein